MARKYLCSDCGELVRARWHTPGSFEVGCDCTTVPVVPQMRQGDTPSSWHVKRPPCCRDTEPKELEAVYGDGVDYECPECGAGYAWDGEMSRAPDQ